MDFRIPSDNGNAVCDYLFSCGDACSGRLGEREFSGWYLVIRTTG
jgi:hypothetical protein